MYTFVVFPKVRHYLSHIFIQSRNNAAFLFILLRSRANREDTRMEADIVLPYPVYTFAESHMIRHHIQSEVLSYIHLVGSRATKKDKHLLDPYCIAMRPPKEMKSVGKFCSHCYEKYKQSEMTNCRLCGDVFAKQCTWKFHLPKQFRVFGKGGKFTSHVYSCRIQPDAM